MLNSILLYTSRQQMEKGDGMANNQFLVFTKRPSGNRGIGGRGEYELAGESNGFKSSELVGKHFYIHLYDKDYPTPVHLTNQGGKPRLRLSNPNDRKHVTHIAGLVASLLMLPSPCRSESKASHALPVLQDDAYLLDVSCRLLDVAEDVAIVEPVWLTARSGALTDDIHTKIIEVDQRVSQIKEMLEHASASLLGGVVNGQLSTFKHAIEGPGEDFYYQCRTSVDAIMDALADVDADYLNGVDSLPFLRSLLKLYVLDIEDIPSPEALPPIRTNSDLNKAVQRRQRAERWYRRKEERGASASRFANDVMIAYHRRCVVCGLELPKTGMGRSGIEAAHILPWADFDLDVVTNGLALCRNHHWAFDSRVITLVCNDARRNTYILRPGDHYEEFEQSVSLPNEIVNELGERGSRPIDEALLPADKAFRPSPDYLERFNGLFSLAG